MAIWRRAIGSAARRMLVGLSAALIVTLSAPVAAAMPVAASGLAAPITDLDAWGAAKLMGIGTNIGNTLDNTTRWETGWGNPRITQEYIQKLAALGFSTLADAQARCGGSQLAVSIAFGRGII